METPEQQRRTPVDTTLQGVTDPHEQERVEDSTIESKSKADEERCKALAAAYRLILSLGQKKQDGRT